MEEELKLVRAVPRPITLRKRFFVAGMGWGVLTWAGMTAVSVAQGAFSWRGAVIGLPLCLVGGYVWGHFMRRRMHRIATRADNALMGSQDKRLGDTAPQRKDRG